MAAVEVLKNDEITVFFYPEHGIIHHVMHRQVQGQPFRDALLAGTETLEKHHGTKWLSDDRLNPMLQPSDRKWGNDVWQPRILKAGWKFWALVMPEEEAGKLRMGLMAEQYAKQGVTVKVFSDSTEGLAWLKSV